jgi:hypothetical protein
VFQLNSRNSQLLDSWHCECTKAARTSASSLADFQATNSDEDDDFDSEPE